jgi:copper chaperone
MMGLELPISSSNRPFIMVQPMSQSTLVKFMVSDMACGGCASTIETAVRNLDAAAQFTADTETKQVTITTTIDAATLQKTITDAGYSPVLV